MSANGQIVRAPANYTVTSSTAPLRAGSYPAGYQIINRSVQATIWASDNSAVRDGQGIPIPGGTSITWTQDGDLFLVLGTDALTVQAGSAPVTISYTSEDYQPSPAAIAVAVLNSGQLVSARQQKLSVGSIVDGLGGVINLDVSTYQSLYLELWNSLVGTPGAGQITVSWYGTNPLNPPDFATYQQAVDTITFITGATLPVSGSAPRQAYQFPVRAPFVQIGGYGSGLNVDVIGSTAPCPLWSPRAMNPSTVGVGSPTLSGAYGSLGALLANALAVGAATPALVTPPWFGEVEVRANIVNGSTSAYCTISGLGANSNIVDRFSLKDGTDGAFTANVNIFNHKRYWNQGSELSVTVNNVSGVAANVQIQVVPVGINR